MSLVEDRPSGLPVVWSEPFGRCARMVRMSEGRTIAELVAEGIANHGLALSFMDYGVVCINGEEVPREFWRLVRPRIRTKVEVVVTFHLPLQGGGGGGTGGSSGKNPLGTIALIAVLVASTLISGGLGLPVLGGTLIGSLTVGQALGTAVLIGGSLAVAALIPPPRISQPTTSNAGATNNEGLPASLSANVLLPGASIPRVIGTRRIYPPAACEPLNELNGNDEFVECVYVLSGPHFIEGYRAGSVNFADIFGLDFEIQDGLPNSSIQDLVSRQGKTIRLNTDMHSHKVKTANNFSLDSTISLADAQPQWEPMITREAPDEFWIRLAFVEGLSVDSAPTSVITVPMRFRIRQRGTVSWTNLPEVHFSSSKTGAFQKDVRLIWSAPPSVLNVPPSITKKDHGFKLSVDRAPVYAYKHVPGQVLAPTDTGWDADSYFSAGAGNDLLEIDTFTTTNVRNVEMYYDKVIFYFNPSTFPQSGIYEVQAIRGTAYLDSSFNNSTYAYTPDTTTGLTVNTYSFFTYQILTAGSFSSAPNGVVVDHTSLHDRIVIVSTASVWNENPLNDNSLASISIRIRGRSLDQISVLASGYVYDWDGSGWNTLTTTSNPVPHYYDILTGNLNADPLPVDLVDTADLVTWRQRCIDKSYTCDLVADGRPAYDMLTTIAASGYARPRQSEKWGVFLDKDRSAEAPIQVFTPRNMSGFRFERPFPLLPTGLHVRFDDSTNDYIEDETIVLDPLNPEADESRLEDQRYDTFVIEADAVARAEFDLKQAELRFVFYYGTCDAENIVCRRGDLIAVQHDVLLRQAGFARVKTVIGSSTITGLVLDGSIPVPTEDAWTDIPAAWSSYSSAWSSPRTGIAIRLNDDTILVKEVLAATDPATTLTFVNPFPDVVTLDVNCLVTSGPLGQVYERMLVFDIQPKGSDFTADLTFVPEAPELWGNATAARIAREEGLLEDLVLCLDAGDGDSYTPGTSLVWRDTSGQGNNFYFGMNGIPQ